MKKKWYKTWWGIVVIILFFPIFLIAFLTHLIWKQKWKAQVRIAVIVGLWSLIIIPGLISDKQKPKAESSASQGNCIGPDGKRIGLSPEGCEEFNNAWKNKQQNTSVSNNTIQPTSQPTTPPKNKPVPTNTPAPQTNRTDILTILKANASTKWGTDYEMVQYEYNNQVEAYNWVVAQTKYPDIMTKAKGKWGNDYEMVKYEYENQVEAYEWVKAQTTYPNIMASAKQKWNDDYEMVKYEYNNQVEAYKNL